jgi:hypothetical protein
MIAGANTNTNNMRANLEIPSCEGNSSEVFRALSLRLAKCRCLGITFRIWLGTIGSLAMPAAMGAVYRGKNNFSQCVN